MIKENTMININNTRIYCDMDGVLADFKSAIPKVTGMSYKEWGDEPKKVFKTIRDKWKPVKDKKDFWPTLPYMPGAKRLWAYISKYDPHILSAYVEQVTDPNCIPGKQKWLRTHLQLNQQSRIHLVKRREKQNYATLAGKPAILIDDYEKNISQFKSAGGIGILHTSADRTISELKKLGFK